jgi:D-xylulose kinase
MILKKRINWKIDFYFSNISQWGSLMVNDEFIAAIDVGTTGARTIIFDINGKLKANAYQEYSIITPKPNWVEQKAGQWWFAVCKTTKEAITKGKVEPKNIIAVAVTNQRETIVPVDRSGEPLHNALVWQDRRTTKQCDNIKKKIGDAEIYRTTGLTLDPYFSASKIMWMKENKAKIFNKTYKFLLVHDYVTHKLTDEFCTDHSNASRTMLFDIKKFKWSDSICEQLGISLSKLPESVPSGTIIGEVIDKAASGTGLQQGTTVVAGGGDQQCAALGLGVIKEGMVKATTGTGTFVLGHLSKPKLDKKRRVICSASVLPNQWVLEASIFSTGAVYRWFRDNFAKLEIIEAKKHNMDVYDLLNKQIEASEPGARGLLLIPHFVGAGAPHWDPEAKGMLYGLSLGHNKSDILRAIIEGICLEIKNSLEVFSELGMQIRELRIAGGATRADIWNQIQADVYGVPVVKTEFEETTALGVAILACVGSGVYRNPQDAVKNLVKVQKKYKPKPKQKDLYKKLFEKHKALYHSIKNLKF